MMKGIYRLLRTFHVEHGIVRYLLSLRPLPLLDSALELLVCWHHHDGLAQEPVELGHLPLPGRGEHVGLVQNIVPPPPDGQLEEVVEALCALADEYVPASVVVVLAREALHLHPVDQAVGAQDVVALVRALAGVVLRPVGLAGAGEADHQQALRVEE